MEHSVHQGVIEQSYEFPSSLSTFTTDCIIGPSWFRLGSMFRSLTEMSVKRGG